MNKYVIIFCVVIGILLWIIPTSFFIMNYVGDIDIIVVKDTLFENNNIYIHSIDGHEYLVSNFGTNKDNMRSKLSVIKYNDTIMVRHNIFDYDSIMIVNQ